MPFNWIDKLKSKFTGGDSESNAPFNPKRALMWIGASLVLAAFGQYAFTQGLVLLAVLDFTVAVWIFVVNIRPFLAETYTGKQDLPETPAEMIETQTLNEPGPEPAPSLDHDFPLGDGIAGIAQRWGLIKHHWRELTIYEIFTASYASQLAGASSQAISISNLSPAVIEKEPESKPAPSQSPSALDEAEIAVQEEPTKQRREGQITRLDGGTTPFDQPQAIAVTPSGDVLVLDVGQEIVYRYDPDGELLGEWSVSGLDQLHVYDLTVSPDGETIYLIDTDDQSVYKIALS